MLIMFSCRKSKWVEGFSCKQTGSKQDTEKGEHEFEREEIQSRLIRRLEIGREDDYIIISKR